MIPSRRQWKLQTYDDADDDDDDDDVQWDLKWI